MERDAVGRRHVVAQHPGSARRVAQADPAIHDLRRDEVAARVEGDVVGGDDVTTLGADGLDGAGVDVERADLTAGDLRDVDAAVRAGTQAVGAEQPAGRGDAVEPPALGHLRYLGGCVATLLLPLVLGNGSATGRHRSDDSNSR